MFRYYVLGQCALVYPIMHHYLHMARTIAIRVGQISPITWVITMVSHAIVMTSLSVSGWLLWGPIFLYIGLVCHGITYRQYVKNKLSIVTTEEKLAELTLDDASVIIDAIYGHMGYQTLMTHKKRVAGYIDKILYRSHKLVLIRYLSPTSTQGQHDYSVLATLAQRCSLDSSIQIQASLMCSSNCDPIRGNMFHLVSYSQLFHMLLMVRHALDPKFTYEDRTQCRTLFSCKIT